MKKSIITILLALISAFFLVACANGPSANNPPYSILDKSLCTLPCWNNIIPGETSKEEFLEIVPGLQYVDQSSIIEINSSSRIYDEEVRFKISPDQKRGNIITAEAFIQKDKVIMVALFGQLGIDLGEIVSSTGEPEGLLTEILPGNYNVIIMFNQSKGLVYDHASYDADFNLEPRTSITGLTIFSKDNYEELIEEGMFSMSRYNKDETLRIMYPWLDTAASARNIRHVIRSVSAFAFLLLGAGVPFRALHPHPRRALTAGLRTVRSNNPRAGLFFVYALSAPDYLIKAIFGHAILVAMVMGRVNVWRKTARDDTRLKITVRGCRMACMDPAASALPGPIIRNIFLYLIFPGRAVRPNPRHAPRTLRV